MTLIQKMTGNEGLYTGIFFQNGLHMTWDYNPGRCECPNDVKQYDEVTVDIIGGVFSDDIGFLICETPRDALFKKCYPVQTQRNNKTPLHITLYNANVSPVISGKILESMSTEQRKSILFDEDKQYKWIGRWNIYKTEKEEENDRDDNT